MDRRSKKLDREAGLHSHCESVGEHDGHAVAGEVVHEFRDLPQARGTTQEVNVLRHRRQQGAREVVVVRVARDEQSERRPRVRDMRCRQGCVEVTDLPTLGLGRERARTRDADRRRVDVERALCHARPGAVRRYQRIDDVVGAGERRHDRAAFAAERRRARRPDRAPGGQRIGFLAVPIVHPHLKPGLEEPGSQVAADHATADQSHPLPV